MFCHFDIYIVLVDRAIVGGQFPKIFAVCKPAKGFSSENIWCVAQCMYVCVCYSDFHNTTGRREKSKSQAFKVGRIIFVLPLCVECRFCPRATQMRKKKVEKRYIGEEMIPQVGWDSLHNSNQQFVYNLCYAWTAYYLQSSACNDSD